MASGEARLFPGEWDLPPGRTALLRVVLWIAAGIASALRDADAPVATIAPIESATAKNAAHVTARSCAEPA